MNSEYSAKQEKLIDKLRSERMWSYFKERPVIITHVLLALSFVLLIALFAVVHSNKLKPESKDLATKDDILSLNITVNLMVEKMKEVDKTAKKRTSCETGWQQFDGSCYFFTNIKTNWYSARSTCILMSADLTIINNALEQKFISGITVNTHHWIGLNDIESEGNWTWIDGTDYKSSYKSWMPYEPNNSGHGEDCVLVWKQGNWNDDSCHNNNMYAICEKKL